MTPVVDPAPLLRALNEGDIPYVVVGGFAVIANGYVRATEDLDVLVPAERDVGSRLRDVLARLGATAPDGSAIPAAKFDGEHHIRAKTEHGLLDVIPEGESPLTYSELAASALEGHVDDQPTRIADLAHVVVLKRLADRPRDRDDLANLEIAHGTLPEVD